MTEIDKAQGCDVCSEIDETHPTSTCRNIGHGVTCCVPATAVKCAYLEWWEQDHLQRSSSDKHLSGSVDQAAAVKQRGDGEPKDGGEV